MFRQTKHYSCLSIIQIRNLCKVLISPSQKKNQNRRCERRLVGHCDHHCLISKKDMKGSSYLSHGSFFGGTINDNVQ